MTGVKIDNHLTRDEWGLILLADVSVEAPALKTTYVDIAGTDNAVNLSYALGKTYKQRKVSFNLFKAVDDVTLGTLRSTLMGLFHGAECKLWLPDDNDFYFKGVVQVGGWRGYNSGIIPVSMLADAYRYKNALTSVTKEVDGELEVTLTNAQRPAVPTVTTDAEVSITYDGTTYTVGAGTSILGFTLPAGQSTLTLEGEATVTISYQEAKF